MTSINSKDLESRIQKLKVILDEKTSKLNFIQNQIKNIDTEISSVNRKLISINKASVFCDFLIEKLNQASVEDIENLISEALQFIFEKPYIFKMKPATLRGNVTYNFTLEINGREEEDLMNCQGGGIISVISILMRIITILISDPPLRRIIFLDESCAQISKQYLGRTAEFIKNLSNKLDFTVVLVTHQDEFKDHVDVVYEVENGNVQRL